MTAPRQSGRRWAWKSTPSRVSHSTTEEILLQNCSINRHFEAGPRKQGVLYRLPLTPWTPKSCMVNLQPISQAGRRGFDPRLPLHTEGTPLLKRKSVSPSRLTSRVYQWLGTPLFRRPRWLPPCGPPQCHLFLTNIKMARTNRLLSDFGPNGDTAKGPI